MTLHKYYMLQRPPVPGSIPGEGLYQTKDFEERRECMGKTVRAWGWALYTRRLELSELAGYELAYGGEVKR
jgi:kininogen-1